MSQGEAVEERAFANGPSLALQCSGSHILALGTGAPRSAQLGMSGQAVRQRHAPADSRYAPAPPTAGPAVGGGGSAIEDDMALTPEEAAKEAEGWQRDLLAAIALFVGSTLLLAAWLAYWMWPMGDENWERLELPVTLDRAKTLGVVMREFYERHPERVYLAHIGLHLYLQAFCIPGTSSVNILAGALYGVPLAYPLCLVYATLGSVLCFFASKLLGRRMILRFFPAKLEQLHQWVAHYHDRLATKMVFLRLMPVSPNWFMNLASPHLHVPLRPFMVGILVGLTPYNFLTCKAGPIIVELSSSSEIIDRTTSMWLFILGFSGLLGPRILKRLFGQLVE